MALEFRPQQEECRHRRVKRCAGHTAALCSQQERASPCHASGPRRGPGLCCRRGPIPGSNVAHLTECEDQMKYNPTVCSTINAKLSPPSLDPHSPPSRGSGSVLVLQIKKLNDTEEVRLRRQPGFRQRPCCRHVTMSHLWAPVFRGPRTSGRGGWWSRLPEAASPLLSEVSPRRCRCARQQAADSALST